MIFLRQSTTVTLRVGPFLDKTDGVTEKTALSPVVEISKNNGAFAARGSATAITHDSNGWYAVELNATDTGTLGPLILKSDDATTYLPVPKNYMVMPAAVYDGLFGAGTLPVDATKWAGAATATNDVALATAPSNFASLSITAAGLVDITQAAADKVWSSTTRTLSAFSTALAVAVWDVLETAVATASSMGMKVKTNLDAAISSRSTFDPTADAVANVTTVGNMRGTDSAALAVNYTAARAAKIDNLDAAISSRSTFAPAVDTVANVTTVGNMRGTDGAALAVDYTTARAAKLDNLDAAISTRSTLDAATVKAQIDQALSGDAQTESYAAKGASATIVQLLYMLLSALGDYGVSGTTITTRKLDGTTTAMTFSINDSASPTSRSRAT